MTKIAGWRLYGESSCNDLIAGLLPANGMHFLVCADDDTRKAVVADMAVANASGNVGSIVQEAKKADGWRFASGFLGLEVGEAKGVAIIGAATWNDVKAAAAWRGQDDLPIAVSTSHLNDVVSVRLHDFADAIKPTPLGLVVVSANWSRGVEEVRRILNFGNGSWAVCDRRRRNASQRNIFGFRRGQFRLCLARFHYAVSMQGLFRQCAEANIDRLQSSHSLAVRLLGS